ncbi:transposase [Streptomyces sp. NPDC048415]|uniref:transposase n=1 Tax=Streptomyces sp. NPDC048415 TaxID=3154822 RepID=UPI003439AE17
MLMRDRLDVVFEDEDFADLYPRDGRPGLSPGQLALVSVLQIAENLSDRAAANAVRTRIDWKYALGMKLDDPGFDHSVLCEFRARLTEGNAADRLLQVMLNRLVEAGLLKAGGRQRTDATHVLAAVRRLSRLELAGESLRAALEQLAQAAPDWLLPLVEPEWDKRYGRKVEIGKVPGGKAGVTALAEAFGRDGCKVLAAAWAPDAPPRLRALPQVEILRRVWVHHYYWDARGRLRWRDGHALPPASLCPVGRSPVLPPHAPPYDPRGTPRAPRPRGRRLDPRTRQGRARAAPRARRRASANPHPACGQCREAEGADGAWIAANMTAVACEGGALVWPRAPLEYPSWSNPMTRLHISSTLAPPHQGKERPMASNPYFNQPLTPARPRMFDTARAKVIWILVPIVSAGLAAAVPFVVAAVKGVVKPWLAVTYAVGEIAIFGTAIAISPDPNDPNPVPGFLMVMLIITAATHTALLDNDKISIGK